MFVGGELSPSLCKHSSLPPKQCKHIEVADKTPAKLAKKNMKNHYLPQNKGPSSF